jgi:hypothetical protein
MVTQDQMQSPMSPGFVMSMEPLTVIPVDGGEREITIGSWYLVRTRESVQ